MPTLKLRWITFICDSMNMAVVPALTRSRKSRRIYRLAWLQSENISGTRWTLSSMTDVHQKENKNLWVGPTLISYEARELMNKSDNGCSTKPPEITVQDESVTIVTSKPPAGPQDDKLNGSRKMRPQRRP